MPQTQLPPQTLPTRYSPPGTQYVPVPESHAPSIAGDAIPSVSYSRPSLPAPTNSTVIFELDEEISPLKKARKLDHGVMVKRVNALEDAQRKVWTNIARRDVAKAIKSSLRDSMDACTTFDAHFPDLSCASLFTTSFSDRIPLSMMQVPEAKRLAYDSAKLVRLNTLLQELKAGDHRVLIYFQMTRMMDLMGEYLIYRQYKYFRLDGSSKLEDRRDVAIDWQTKPDIFVFLLSTRAGGLGINLTAADTVVCYGHDRNPESFQRCSSHVSGTSLRTNSASDCAPSLSHSDLS
ncbi:P-loop containing nucleoside triphosphate hydrolase protein [Armillaria luteobubalina]|uniref:Chromatin-remodeling ATPase INO80 n=1 Tax=Armillaria luteobubalina TaxID=153913 RepID=A0AA39QK71_9AGAR|nr:P-loop containing nucleoside triphosphate hydrolase protein [Armillaria luteobubalina]